MANVTGSKAIESAELVSPGVLSKAHRLSKRGTIWFSCFVVALVLTGWMMLLTGQLDMDLDIGGIEEANPYIVVIVTGIVITTAAYAFAFVLGLPIVLLWSLIRKNNINP